jgi:hypothetical protein
MADEKTTKKVTKTTAKQAAKPDLPTQILELVRKPGVVVTLLAAVGLTGQDIVTHVNTLLSMDLPAYTLLVLAGGYVVARWLYDYMKSQRSMAGDVKALVLAFDEFREWTRDRLQSGDDNLSELMASRDDHDNRITLIESAFQAEILAYVEERERDTGKLKAPKDQP